MSTTKIGYIFAWAGDPPPGLRESLNALQEVGLLPTVGSWWFAWRETEILLPQRLGDSAALPTNWDELHVFSAQAEFRQVRQGRAWRRLLLIEKEALSAVPNGWQRLEPWYQAIEGRRVLWGRRLHLPGGERRGEVLFPRPLDYDIAGETPPYQQALVADVWLYHDAEARLHTARYAGLRHVGAGELRVESLSQQQI